MTKLEQLDLQILELQKQKQIEELKIEIEKIKKIKIEETVIEKGTVYRCIKEYPWYYPNGVTYEGTNDTAEGIPGTVLLNIHLYD